MTRSTHDLSREEAALDLMSQALREGRPLAAEYPLVFGENTQGHIEVLEAGGEPASTCAWLERTLVTPSCEVPVALVGSVATRADRRGQGLGAAVLDLATTKAASEGAALSLLWADDPSWYQERGWVPFGTETIYVIDGTMAFLLPDPDGVRAARPEDAAAIHQLYANRPVRVDRTEDETRAMLGVPAMQVVVNEQGGRIVGYACMGRGEDLQQVIHEWAGTPQDALPCVSELWRTNHDEVERLFMMSPPREADFVAYFDFVKARGASGILCMARVGSTEALARVFDEATPDGVTATATGPATIDVTGPGGTIRLTDHQILLALCPPRGDRRVTEVVEADVGTELPQLPIQPFIWGLDSI
ncbi:MAG: GNAT family N-acetyltransferase [Planctomycetota bacterium]|nr:GNAT family N-acetyltransferase [Planctomycetota bacterium]